MSESDKDFEEMIDKLDAGRGAEVPEGEKEIYDSMVKGIQYLEETSFRERLTETHEKYEGGKTAGKKYYWVGGIAASVIGALFWWSSFDSEPVQFELKMDEAPLYADSASYDSLRKVESEVDKLEK